MRRVPVPCNAPRIPTPPHRPTPCFAVGSKLLFGLGVDKTFAIPGEPEWQLSGHIANPQTREETGTWPH